MKNLFDINNPVIQMLSRMADMMFVNILFVLCCLPVITAGASYAAAVKMIRGIYHDEYSGVAKGFFSAFKQNFKQATASWLLALFMLLSLGCSYVLIKIYFTGTMHTVLLVGLCVLAVLYLGILAYLFPLLTRFQNTMREHITNALILSVIKLPRTLGMIAVQLFPLLLAYFSPKLFAYTIIFWIVLGISIQIFMNVWILNPVFTQLEEAQE